MSPRKSTAEDLQQLHLMVREIHVTLLGHENAKDEGVLQTTKRNERDIASLRTTLKTIWAVIVAIPVVAGVIAMFVDMPPVNARQEYRQ